MTTEQRNETFSKMTSAQKRVEIAKDVITQIDIKQYNPTRGIYISSENDLPESDIGQSLQACLPKLGTCDVCAVGAAVLSAVRLFNDVTVQTASGVFDPSSKMHIWFEENQVELIEHAFECWRHPDHDTDNDNGSLFPITRFDHYRNSADRLIVIMENIIRNDGEFTPTWNDVNRPLDNNGRLIRPVSTPETIKG